MKSSAWRFAIAIATLWCTAAPGIARVKNETVFHTACGDAALPPARSFPNVLCLAFCGEKESRVGCRFASAAAPWYSESESISGVKTVAIRARGDVTVLQLARQLRGASGFKVLLDSDVPSDGVLAQFSWEGSWADLEHLGIKLRYGPRFHVIPDDGKRELAIRRRAGGR